MKRKLLIALFAAVAMMTVSGARASAKGGLDYVSAAVNWGNGKVYFFGVTEALGLAYVRYDIRADKADAGYPKAVTDKPWPGLEKMTAMIGAVNWGNGKVYFFGHYDDSGTLFYARFDMKANKVDKGYPKAMSADYWPGVNSIEFLDSAFNWGSGLVYFTGHDENQQPVYITYDMAKDKPVQKKPAPMNQSTWPGWTLDYLTTGVDWGNGKVYVFGGMNYKEEQYYARYDKKTNRMDSGYPKLVKGKIWPGLFSQD
jgi:hypothetical protein